jgi:hypothetical protein
VQHSECYFHNVNVEAVRKLSASEPVGLCKIDGCNGLDKIPGRNIDMMDSCKLRSVSMVPSFVFSLK